MDLIYIKRMYLKRAITMIIIFILVMILVAIVIVNYVKKATSMNACFKQTEAQISRISPNKTKKQNGIITAIIENNKNTPILTQKGKENMSQIYKSDKKRVFLTFDDGPSKTVTIPILDLLKQEKIKATFFVLGSRVELYPNIVKREYEEGHYIANHGYSHMYSQIYSSVQSVLDEYNKTNNAVRKAIGVKEYNSHLFRFPGGVPGGRYAQLKKEAVAELDKNNIAHVDWNALTGDAEGKNSVEELVSELQETMGEKNSLVILMHDAGNKKTTYEALPTIISMLREKGYEFKNFYDIIK